MQETRKGRSSAPIGKSKKGYLIAVCSVRELRAAGLTCVPRPMEGNPGHCEITDLRSDKLRYERDLGKKNYSLQNCLSETFEDRSSHRKLWPLQVIGPVGDYFFFSDLSIDSSVLAIFLKWPSIASGRSLTANYRGRPGSQRGQVPSVRIPRAGARNPMAIPCTSNSPGFRSPPAHCAPHGALCLIGFQMVNVPPSVSVKRCSACVAMAPHSPQGMCCCLPVGVLLQ